MVSEPACCPFCVQENFGVVYTPPAWRTGIGSEGWVRQFILSLAHEDGELTSAIFRFGRHSQAHPTWPDSPKGSQRSFDSTKVKHGKQRRFKSYDHTDPEVVTVGMSLSLSLL
jgi:hypothetical protein